MEILIFKRPAQFIHSDVVVVEASSKIYFLLIVLDDAFREFSLTVSEHQVNQVCCAVSARRVFVVKAIYRAVKPQHNELRKYIIN